MIKMTREIKNKRKPHKIKIGQVFHYDFHYVTKKLKWSYGRYTPVDTLWYKDSAENKKNDKCGKGTIFLKNSSPDSNADFSEKFLVGIWRFILSAWHTILNIYDIVLNI